MQKDVARVLVADAFDRRDSIGELRQRRGLGRADVDQHGEDRKIQLGFALAQPRQPFGTDLRLAVGDNHDVAALEFLLAEQLDGGVDWSFEVGAAAGEVFGHLDDLVQVGLIAPLAIEVDDLEAHVARRKHDSAEQPALAPRNIHQRQRDRLRPHLLVALHRGAHVDTYDHRALALLLVVAQAILKHSALEHAAIEIALEDGMMHREQLRRYQAAELGAKFDVVGFGDAALERFALESARVLLEAPDHPRQLAEFLVAREAPAELESRTGCDAPALPEFAAEVVAVLSGLIDLARQLGRL